MFKDQKDISIEKARILGSFLIFSFLILFGSTILALKIFHGSVLYASNLDVLTKESSQENTASEQLQQGSRIQTEKFCANLTAIFSRFALNRGLGEQQSKVIGTETSMTLVEELRQGSLADFINMGAIKGVFTEKQNNYSSGEEKSILSLSSVLAASLGITSENIMLAHSFSELKYLPHVQVGSAIIFVGNDLSELNIERARTVTDVANRQKIKIFVVWTSAKEKSQDPSSSASLLFDLATATGGQFIDLGGLYNPCLQVF